ncbi:MAG: peptidase C69, partial [Thermus sp.]
MLQEDLVEGVLKRALQGGADFAELYVERSKRRRMTVRNGQLEEAISGLEYGAGLRLFFGREVVYAYTNDLTPESLLEALESLLRARGGLGRVDDRGAGGLDFRREVPKGLHAPRVPLSAKDKRYRLERLLEAETAARLAP